MVRPCWGAQQHEEAQRGWWWLRAGRALAALSQELPWEPTEDAHRVQSRGAWYWYLRPCMASSLQLVPTLCSKPPVAMQRAGTELGLQQWDLRAARCSDRLPLALLELSCTLNWGQQHPACSWPACLCKQSLPGCTNSRLFVRVWVVRALTSMPAFHLPRTAGLPASSRTVCPTHRHQLSCAAVPAPHCSCRRGQK